MNSSENTQQTRRCSRCLLPSSLPGFSTNKKGECNWCQSGFPNYEPKGMEALQPVLDANRNSSGPADCLVGVSGGKDSSYALLDMTRRMEGRVEAFTYVHDGLTEFALQNAVDLCKTLGVKHHVVSLPNHAHLESFKAFFRSWIESEDPIAAAMTCVACKHLHILGTRLASQRKIPLVVWASCPLESPPFIPGQASDEEKVKRRGTTGMGLMLVNSMLAKQSFRQAFLKNKTTCCFGCLAFRPNTRYVRMRYPKVKHLFYFDYWSWNAETMVSELKTHTSWSIPESVGADWHSDCVFNVFKEYMFQTMLGASYQDAFLSNQIRYGLITREKAWAELLEGKNNYRERFDTALATVGLEELRDKCDLSCFDIAD